LYGNTDSARRPSLGSGTDLAVDAAVAGVGIISPFEDWLRPYFDGGALEPVLASWWMSFSGPFLYYSGRRLVPAPLRAFIDFVRAPGRRRGAATKQSR
jgi:DNA-binding transcriptional LysR family regulator